VINHVGKTLKVWLIGDLIIFDNNSIVFHWEALQLEEVVEGIGKLVSC